MRIFQLICFLFFILFQSTVASTMPLSSSFPPELSVSGHHGDECSVLFHLSKSFIISRNASEYSCDYISPISYPKTTTWKNGTDCCTWDGIACDDKTRNVVGLDLSCSWLQGTLPPNSTLFSLQHLHRLNLAGNDFGGSPISPRFGTLTSMTHLNLSDSQFSGLVPLELSRLSRLLSLDLSGSFGSVHCPRLEDQLLRRLFQNLTDLRDLVLDTTDMSSVSPDSIRNISSSLTHLEIVGSSLKGRFPIGIFRLPNLKNLNLAYNYDLEGTLPEVNWTSPLVHLDLTRTKFHGKLANSVVHLKYIKELLLKSCQFDGPLPDSLGNLTNLNVLHLSNNSFTGHIPRAIGNLEELTILNLSYNNLSIRGSMDFEIIFSKLKHLQLLWLPSKFLLTLQDHGNCSFPDLEMLVLYDCSLTKFPYFLQYLKKISVLDLSDNNLSGTIPECFGSLSELELLDLSSNQLEGPLPRSLANCSKLASLYISKNNIFDTFPDWLMVPSLRSLGLKSNKFHGLVASEISFAQITSLDVSDNNFSGILPPNIFLNSTLQTFDLSNNRFSGLAPNLSPTIEFFSLSGNLFTGEIPSSVCNTSRLAVINLSNNSMSGPIPPCLANSSSSLLVANLRMNMFVGKIPEFCVPGNNLTSIDLSQNQLGGALPQSFANCKNLEVLNLGDNRLQDSFPSWLYTLPMLQVLILRSNMFYGHLNFSENSDHLFVKLRILDLSNNNFSGPLPTTVLVGLNAMKNEGKSDLQYMEDRSNGYQDSVKIIMKGAERILVRILMVFTTIDMSRNSFEGFIPEAIGNLKALKGLNFSHNALSGNITSSLGNLTNLEWLDLSLNKLTGRIPTALAELASLAYLNLSVNQLTGTIPRSTQFDTFNRDSFDGNPGLCGHPLPNACDNAARPGHSSDSPVEREAEYGNRIEWRAVVLGYGFGLGSGISAGYIVLVTRRPRWLVQMVERKRTRKTSQSRKTATPRNHTRRS